MARSKARFALLLALAVLTVANQRALQGAKLSPNARNAIGTLITGRPVVLARATFATYTGPLGVSGGYPILSVLMPAGQFQVGDYLRLQIGGTATNTTGGSVGYGALLRFTQGLNTTTVGFAPNDTSAAGSFGWRSEILVGVGIEGASGQYGRGAIAVSNVFQPNSQPKIAQAISFTGYGMTQLTDRSFSVPPYAGGFIIAPAAGGVGSTIVANTAQVGFLATQPILVEVLIGGVFSANQSVTVTAGILEGL